MSLLVAGLLFAGTSGAVMVGRWMARRRKAEAKEEDGPPKPANEASGEEGEDAPARAKRPAGKRRPPPADRPQIEGFLCQLGDVVIRITGEEAWLEGGVILSEEVPVAALFVAPDVGRSTAIYVRARPKASLLWLEPLDPSAILVGGEPPSSVEHRGVRFDRARRLPLRPQRMGIGAPEVGDAVTIAEYTSAGAERLLVVKANTGAVHAYRGTELEEGSFEVIASGDSTLES